MPFHFWPGDYQPTRREFVTGLTVGVGGMALALAEPTAMGVDERDARWYALVSDVHISHDTKKRVYGQNMADHLRAVLADILAVPVKPDGVLINGDLACREGKPGDYKTLFRLLEPLQKARIPVHFVLGNHDDRRVFRHAVASRASNKTQVTERQVAAFDAMGHRFVLLDSLDQVDQAPGRLGRAQLDWLANELDSQKDRPTLVFVHHNPKMGEFSGLVDHEDFFAVIRERTWVKAVVHGHTHSWGHDREGDIDLINLPATAYGHGGHQPLGYCQFRFADGKPKFQLREVVGRRRRHGETVTPVWRA